MNNSVREGDAPPFFETSFNLCREVEFSTSFRLCREAGTTIQDITCEEVKSVESKFFFIGYIVRARTREPEKKRFSSGLHGNTAADSVRSEWPFCGMQPKSRRLRRRRGKSKPERKLLDIRVERLESERRTREVREAGVTF
ncbi:hypothetical protein TNCV_1195571 [Trichonephila clavipes]|nr:hypothetical protein TNCV_1195571 [Trichonephila clavipes]